MKKHINNRIFFAGEHTSIEYFSCVLGALLEGYRAASEIL